ncbi:MULTISPECIES: hypothetical protein [unclassified Pseudomonas]|uniref:hypothetical protein n=1 Tax=unclassified Pseudomonas TaxID=196821 RepID=UPI000C5640A1|nr:MULTISPECIES: hypothetical protein [unclassified Pseudomonas]MCM2364742.1 hypothetical protein [Pseudomonas sp. SR18]PIB59441.1 hypothetical protein AOA60_16635 [Pseudomonas sp. 2822-17]
MQIQVILHPISLAGTPRTFKETVAYYNLKGYGGYHSGDIVDAPKGASEFIDLDLDVLVKKGIRYVVTSINGTYS